MTLLLGFSAVNTGNNLLFLIVSGLLAFMSITGLAGMLNIAKLTPQLLSPAEVFAGTPTSFRLRVLNKKRFLPSFLITLVCPDGRSVMLPLVPNGGVAEGNLIITFPKRGWSGVGTITVSSPFPVDFFTRSWTIQVEERFIVYPQLRPVNVTGYDPEADNISSIPRRERGHDGELERIANYSGNEPLRMIHWKLSARGDDLVVKEFGRQSALPLMIDLETVSGRDLEERISSAAWLVRRRVTERPVGLKLGLRTIIPEMGRAHGTNLLTELALYDCD